MGVHHHHGDDSYFTGSALHQSASPGRLRGRLSDALYFWQRQMLSFLLVSESLKLAVLLSGIVPHRSGFRPRLRAWTGEQSRDGAALMTMITIMPTNTTSTRTPKGNAAATITIMATRMSTATITAIRTNTPIIRMRITTTAPLRGVTW